MTRYFQILFLIALFTIAILSQPTNTKRYIAVTFDDLPMNTKYLEDGNQWIEQTEKLLGIIKKYNIPAIGFVNEYKIYVNNVLDSSRIKALQLWVDADLELGNHTFSHPDYHIIDQKDFFEDIIKGERITKELLSQKNKKLEYFRHPFLHTGISLEKKKALEDFLKEHNYTIAPVTIDNGEWIYARAYENAYNKNDFELMEQIGSEYVSYMIDKTVYFENQSVKLFGREIKQILLIHANMINADYFDELAEALMKRNYSFITLKETLTDSAYLSEDTFTGRGGISWLHRWSYTKKVDKSFYAGEPEVSKNILDIAEVDSE
ncbi:MAG: polysaccharide deacetylase family protein [Ignavibacteriales bacterium]|nr:polysaccharide deacetylase family protein [Ignavibacteriales bacterium]